MATVISTITVDFDNHDDALALKDLLEEMGLTVNFSRRVIDPNKTGTLVSSQRMGILFLEEMRKLPNLAFTTDDLKEICEKLLYNPNSYSAVIGKLVTEGKVERLARGLYQVIKESPSDSTIEDMAT